MSLVSTGQLLLVQQRYHTATMIAVAGSVVLGLLVTSANAFLPPAIARASALRRADVKVSQFPSKGPVPGLGHLTRSSFVSGVSCRASRAENGSGSRGEVSMRVVNVGVIGAGRCVTVYCYGLCPHDTNLCVVSQIRSTKFQIHNSSCLASTAAVLADAVLVCVYACLQPD